MLEPQPGETPPDPNNPAPLKDNVPTPAEDAPGFIPGTQNPDDPKRDY